MHAFFSGNPGARQTSGGRLENPGNRLMMIIPLKNFT
jgi:hypothetical protein